MAAIKISSKLYLQWQNAAIEHCRLRRRPEEGPLNTDQHLESLIREYQAPIGQLWDSYNTDRAQLGQFKSSTAAGAATYLLGFHLVNAARAELAMSRLAQRGTDLGQISQGKDVHVIDIGCGTGAMSQLLLTDYLPGAKSVQVTLVDQSAAFIKVAESIFSQNQPAPKVFSLRKAIDQVDFSKILQHSTCDLRIVTMGYLLNEIDHNRRAFDKINQLLALLEKDQVPTLLLILEPAKQEPSHNMMALRDILSQNHWSSRYPCPKGTLKCPMLERAKDWCFSEGFWKQPAAMKFLDKKLLVDRSHLATTAMIFTNPIWQHTPKEQEKTLPVIVGRPHEKNQDQRYRYLFCEGHRLTHSQKSYSLRSAYRLRGETESEEL